MTISFGSRFAQSQQFEAVFSEGMALVERTAAYLDGDGRKEAKALVPPASVVYATESMRLTTRLLELASWLLVQRALKDGEITESEATDRRRNVKLRTMGRPSHIKHFDELPDTLRELITHSFAMTDRVIQIDRALNEKDEPEEAEAPANPVVQQLATLQAAFARRG